MKTARNMWERELTYTQRLALAYAPKLGALISAVTSIWVAILIIRNKQKMAKMYHRLALGLCISSVIKACNIFVTSWCIPSDERGYIHAWGTVQTCTVTGFLSQLGTVVQYYYVSLAIYVFMSLRCEFRIKEIEWIEKYLHIGVFIFPLGSAIFLTTQKMFNPIGLGCWINSSPFGCINSGGLEIECIRGEDKQHFYLMYFGVVPTACNLFLAISIIIICYINEQRKFKKMLKSGCLRGKRIILENARRRKSTLIRRQGTSYLLAFVFSYSVAFIAVLVQVTTAKLVFPSLLVAAIFFPLDGLFFTLSYYFLQDCRSPEAVTSSLKNKSGNESKHSSQGHGLSLTSNTVRKESKMRMSGTNVSLFDGTDEAKWNLYGVYLGDESESSFESDYEFEVNKMEADLFEKQKSCKTDSSIDSN